MLQDFIQIFLFFKLSLPLLMLLLCLALFGECQIASEFSVDFPFVIGFSFIQVWLTDRIAFRSLYDSCQKELPLSTPTCVKPNQVRISHHLNTRTKTFQEIKEAGKA